MAGSLRQGFDDTILKFISKTSKMSKTSEASEDNIHALFEALPFDWETTPLPQLHPYLQMENPTRLLQTLLCSERLRAKNVNINTAKSTGTIR